MKKITIIPGILGLLLLSCAREARMPRIYPMNVDFIESSIEKVTVPEAAFTTRDRVALVSTEFGEPVDIPVNYLIEDRLIEKLYKSNVKVVERDPDILPKLYSEMGPKYMYYPPGFFDFTFYTESTLSSATKILSYRVLDCGMTTEDISEEKVKRTAYTSLFVKIMDSRSNVLWSGVRTGEVSDTMPTNFLASLGGRELYFYSHGLPNKDLIKKRVKLEAPEEEVPTEEAPTPKLLAFAVGGLPALIAKRGGKKLMSTDMGKTIFLGLSHGGLRFGIEWGGTGVVTPILRMSGDFLGNEQTMPLTLGLRSNIGAIEPLRESLKGVNPFVDVGFGYYVGHYEGYYEEYGEEWEFLRFGWNLGFGVEYFLTPRFSIGTALRFHVIFGENNYTDWNLCIGLY